jgi:hypothetical protein
MKASTMTTQSFPISSVGCDPTRDPDVKDDLSTATPPIGFCNSDGDCEFISETIRLYFVPADHTRIDCLAPTNAHTQWKNINNSNKPVLTLDTTTTSS